MPNTDPAHIAKDLNMHLSSVLARSYPHYYFKYTAPANGSRCTLLLPVKPLSSISLSLVGQTPDLVSFFSGMYAFWTGSFVYTIFTNTTKNTSGFYTSTHIPDSFIDVPTGTNTTTDFDAFDDTAYATSPIIPSHQHFFSVVTPYQSIYTNLLTTLPSTITDNSLDTNGTLQFSLYNTDNQTHDLRLPIYRAIGEGFRFSYLIPPAIISIPYMP
jgi:hypothetical protein